MNIYLDVNGVLLTRNLKPALGLKEFLTRIREDHDLYWLTTHCKGSTESVLVYLKRLLPPDIYELVEDIKPTDWDVLKTDGIDFNQKFLWLDDNLMNSEKEVLIKHNSFDCYIYIDLDNNPNQLSEILKAI